MLEQKVVEAYADGNTITLIAERFKISERLINSIVSKYKEENRDKNSFTDEFKKMVAQRDIGGIPRSTIAEELGINPNTVQKFCKEFGQVVKNPIISDRVYTRIDGEFDMKSCPSCKSKKVNKVDLNVIYCKKCGNEHIIHSDHALKINFEYLEE